VSMPGRVLLSRHSQPHSPYGAPKHRLWDALNGGLAAAGLRVIVHKLVDAFLECRREAPGDRLKHPVG